METEVLTINRQQVHVTYVNSPQGIIVYYSYEPPTAIFYGEQVRETDGESIFYRSIENAREQALEILKRYIYPPDFRRPRDYDNESISEIMFKMMLFDIGEVDSNEVQMTLFGMITKCNLAANFPNLPSSITITLEDGTNHRYNIFQLKEIRR